MKRVTKGKKGVSHSPIIEADLLLLPCQCGLPWSLGEDGPCDPHPCFSAAWFCDFIFCRQSVEESLREGPQRNCNNVAPTFFASRVRTATLVSPTGTMAGPARRRAGAVSGPSPAFVASPWWAVAGPRKPSVCMTLLFEVSEFPATGI